jgi:hypothetical protein
LERRYKFVIAFSLVLGATHLPNRFRDQAADLKIMEAIGLLYKEFEKQ